MPVGVELVELFFTTKVGLASVVGAICVAVLSIGNFVFSVVKTYKLPAREKRLFDQTDTLLNKVLAKLDDTNKEIKSLSEKIAEYFVRK